jgi:hypothetical protein
MAAFPTDDESKSIYERGVIIIELNLLAVTNLYYNEGPRRLFAAELAGSL